MGIVEDSHEIQARLARETSERRLQEASEQRSPLNTPAFRIGLWEKRHQLALPRSETHALIDVIATATALSRQEVEDEMRHRASARGSSSRS